MSATPGMPMTDLADRVENADGRMMLTTMHMDAGVMSLSFASNMTDADADDMQALFDIVMRGIRRRAAIARATGEVG